MGAVRELERDFGVDELRHEGRVNGHPPHAPSRRETGTSTLALPFYLISRAFLIPQNSCPLRVESPNARYHFMKLDAGVRSSSLPPDSRAFPDLLNAVSEMFKSRSAEYALMTSHYRRIRAGVTAVRGAMS